MSEHQHKAYRDITDVAREVDKAQHETSNAGQYLTWCKSRGTEIESQVVFGSICRTDKSNLSVLAGKLWTQRKGIAATNRSGLSMPTMEYENSKKQR